MFEDVQIPKMRELINMERELKMEDNKEKFTENFNKKFNNLFIQKNKKTTTGYDNFMVKSEYQNTKSLEELNKKFNANPFTNADRKDDAFKPIKHFKAAEYGMVLYKGLGAGGSDSSGCDYRTAFTDTTKELEYLVDNHKKNYKPKTLEDLQKEREQQNESLRHTDYHMPNIDSYIKIRSKR